MKDAQADGAINGDVTDYNEHMAVVDENEQMRAQQCSQRSRMVGTHMVGLQRVGTQGPRIVGTKMVGAQRPPTEADGMRTW
eukprot:scaffold136340_cov17-Tisochrysis_lutea.AAC.1